MGSREAKGMGVGEWKKHQVSTVVLTKRKATTPLECVGFNGESRGERECELVNGSSTRFPTVVLTKKQTTRARTCVGERTRRARIAR
jgi:hypothetical protein